VTRLVKREVHQVEKRGVHHPVERMGTNSQSTTPEAAECASGPVTAGSIYSEAARGIFGGFAGIETNPWNLNRFRPAEGARRSSRSGFH